MGMSCDISHLMLPLATWRGHQHQRGRRHPRRLAKRNVTAGPWAGGGGISLRQNQKCGERRMGEQFLGSAPGSKGRPKPQWRYGEGPLRARRTPDQEKKPVEGEFVMYLSLKSRLDAAERKLEHTEARDG